MKTKIICVLCCTVVAFSAATACGTSDGSTEKASSSNDVSSNETISVIDSELDNELLENKKNVAGNGVIFIEDSADYPDYIYDIYIPYQDVSSGLWGYCDVDGKILKDAKYAVALGFYDNVAFVCDDKSGEYYLINKNFEPISDKKYDDASYFTNGTAQVMDDTGIYSINSKEEKTDCNFWGEFTQPDNGTGPYGNILGGIIDGVTYISYSKDKIGAFSQSENFAAYYDKNNAELAHFDGYSSCTNFSNGYAFLNGSTVINSNFEIIGNAEYFVSGESSTFYSELWSSTYSDTHVYDGGYFIGSNDFETDLTQKYKVIKIAPELYEEKSQ